MAMRAHLVCLTIYARCQSQSVFWHLLRSSNRPVYPAVSARFDTEVPFCSSRRQAAAMHIAFLNATTQNFGEVIRRPLLACQASFLQRHSATSMRRIPTWFKQQKILGQSGYAEFDTDNAPLPSRQHKKGQHATAHLQQILQHNLKLVRHVYFRYFHCKWHTRTSRYSNCPPADDCAYPVKITYASDVECLLSALNNTTTWCKLWLMELNISKCKVMRVSRNQLACPHYLPNDTTLESVVMCI